MFLSRGDRDLGVAFQTHPGRQAFISSGSKEARSRTKMLTRTNLMKQMRLMKILKKILKKILTRIPTKQIFPTTKIPTKIPTKSLKNRTKKSKRFQWVRENPALNF